MIKLKTLLIITFYCPRNLAVRADFPTSLINTNFQTAISKFKYVFHIYALCCLFDPSPLVLVSQVLKTVFSQNILWFKGLFF